MTKDLLCRSFCFCAMLTARKGVAFMNTYVTGATIKELRENKNLTQAELARKIGVSSKTVSKWETAKGLPDISLLQPTRPVSKENIATCLKLSALDSFCQLWYNFHTT